MYWTILVTVLKVIMLMAIVLCAIMLRIVMICVSMLSVIMLSADMLNVVAPWKVDEKCFPGKCFQRFKIKIFFYICKFLTLKFFFTRCSKN